MKIAFGLLTLICVLSCQTDDRIQVDLLVKNANIYTVDTTFSKAQAFVVNDGKFVAVGSSEDIDVKYKATKTVDASGKTILPGLIDAHCHFYRFGTTLQSVNLVGTKSYDEVLDRVQAFQATQPAKFIYGRGWDQNDWEDKNFPTKQKLDSLFPDIPVALQRIDGHAYLVNQRALDLAKIDNTTIAEG
ncbi:MAG: amidohydrolase family protein, partial [Leeuwenhoekiella sp.]